MLASVVLFHLKKEIPLMLMLVFLWSAQASLTGTPYDLAGNEIKWLR